jgi:hypothetical protein
VKNDPTYEDYLMMVKEVQMLKVRDELLFPLRKEFFVGSLKLTLRADADGEQTTGPRELGTQGRVCGQVDIVAATTGEGEQSVGRGTD